MHTFKDLGLSPDIMKALKNLNFTEPTPIQYEAIPIALEGNDVLGTAQTGSGKTAAFVIPMIEQLAKTKNKSGIILTPTRELAEQVSNVVKLFLGYRNPISSVSLIGGEGIYGQINQLKRDPRIVIGTPGRINDHLERGTLKLDKCEYVVLDETDRMLDMGFGIQVNRILKFIPKNRQTLLFSATLPPPILKLSSKYLNNPIRVSIKDNDVLEVNIKQHVINVHQNDKLKELIKVINSREGTILIFVKTKYGTEKLSKKLQEEGLKSTALHGGLRQNKRSKIMKNYRDQRFRILIATDIASRGLDVPHIETVINHDLPQAPEDFIHRIGRTARAGSVGEAVSFVTPNDRRIWSLIQKLLGIDNKDNNEKSKGSNNKSKGSNNINSKKKYRPNSNNRYNKTRSKSKSNSNRDFKGNYKKRSSGA